MKRIWILIVALMLCLSACGDNAPTEDKGEADNKGSKPAFTFPTQNIEPDQPTKPTEMETGTKPSDSLLWKDLQEQLTARVEKRFSDSMAQTVQMVEVVLSQTEEKLYTASITVTAQSVYADFTWPVDVTYTKYDQGWVMTECTWGEYTYEQVRYPSEEEVQQMAQEYVLPDAQRVDIVHKDEAISYLYDSEANWSEYVKGSCISEIRWAYNDYYDHWEYRGTYGTSNGSFVLTEELEGTWEIYNNSNVVAIIKNVTETGFDMQKGINGATWHFEYRNAYITGKDGGVLWVEFDQEYGNKGIKMALPQYSTEANYVTCDFFIGIYDTSEYWTIYSTTICDKSSKISEYTVETVRVHARFLDNWENPCCWAWKDGGGNAFDEWPGEEMVLWNDFYTIEIPAWADMLVLNGNKGDAQTNDISIEPGREVWIIVNEHKQGKVFYDPEDIIVKPSVPGNNAIGEAINSGDISVTYFHDGGAGWPFIVTTFNGETCIKASNSQIDSSHAVFYANVELKAGQAVGFDYIISSEADADIAYVIINNDIDVYQMSGQSEEKQWQSCYPWVAQKDGIYQVLIIYIKDGSNNVGDDTIYVDNMRVVNKEDIEVDISIPREAAVEQEDRSFSYVDIFYNEKDGYYHVGSADGPLLMANLLGYSSFCRDTIFNMAKKGEIIKDGHDYYEDLYPFLLEAENDYMLDYGYCAVTKELSEILKVVAEIKGYEASEKEWLKICVYYENYGPGTRRP